MANITSTGTSPTITITAENLNLIKYMPVTKIDIEGVNPPELATGAAKSRAMDLIQQWPSWNYDKLTEPKYDGISQHLGTISNRPDFIKDHHMIGIMRDVDFVIKPEVDAYISVEAKMPSAYGPNRESQNGN